MSDTVRTFIAIELPPDVRAYLSDCQARLKPAGGDVKWVRPELIHLTLVFLGDVPAESLGDLEAAVREAVAGRGPIALRASGAGRFPERGLPRVVWVGIEDGSGALAALQKSLADATAVFAEKVEDRSYEPHLTVGRVKSGKDAMALSQAIGALAAAQGPAFEAREVTIFRSDLSPQGPAYTALGRVRLGG